MTLKCLDNGIHDIYMYMSCSDSCTTYMTCTPYHTHIIICKSTRPAFCCRVVEVVVELYGLVIYFLGG